MSLDAHAQDSQLEEVFETLLAADPLGARMASVLRQSFDLLYNGQHTGRYSPDQLFKTEKTHCGSIVEIELRRALDDIISDGQKLDFVVAGHEIDCKFSFKHGGWMLPPECLGELLLVVTADDHKGTWSAGVVRASPKNVRTSTNRDAKTSLNAFGRADIRWLAHDAELPGNVLLRLTPEARDAVFAPKSGQKRVNELFRRAELIPVGRNAVATVAQQDDYMKRVRYNGGARSALQAEGYLIASGDYSAHRQIAIDLGAADVAPGEFISMRVVPCDPSYPNAVQLDSQFWRVAEPHEAVAHPAPLLPDTRR